MNRFENELYAINISCSNTYLWEYIVTSSNKRYIIKGPSFEVDGKNIAPIFSQVKAVNEPIRLNNGSTEYNFEAVYREIEGLNLRICFRVSPGNPVIRFRYELKSVPNRCLTKNTGEERLTYLECVSCSSSTVKEIRFSEFNEMAHSFCLAEHCIEKKHFRNKCSAMGPMLLEANEGHTSLVAYEHGSQVPDAFLKYELRDDYTIGLCAIKGNYYHNESINNNRAYTTLWFQFAAINGGEDVLAETYRNFQLKYAALNTASRKPYIFYNTWAYQERNKWWNGQRYLDSMNQSRMLEEIEIAHQMGIEVFVLDTGWYEKTGDWEVNLAKFPDGLKLVKDRLDGYGMKLGLWFGPVWAAASSKVFKENKTSMMDPKGAPYPVWETEESHPLCLVSDYWEVFADTLIRLSEELGVTYFKWDAVGQYSCKSPDHHHGNERNTEYERSESYAFQLSTYMVKIVEKLSHVCPEAIVDFDITEGERSVGLGFLSAGKYFLINNGPYYANYDIPMNKIANDKVWSNMLVYPGPARAMICRTPLSFDKWIPSVLFLCHYLPDDPESSQMINMASLILGHNGIWGDLTSISNEGVGLFKRILELYKQVREDITFSAPVRVGLVGGSPEVHEKINPATEKGAVVIFGSAKGQYTYVTENNVNRNLWKSEGVEVTFDTEGRAVIDVAFEKAGARIVFFGVH